MKHITLTILLALSMAACSSTPVEPKAAPLNLLIMDSSFAPIEMNGEPLVAEPCYLVAESNEEVATQGACYDAKVWDELADINAQVVKAYLEANARRTTPLAQEWAKLKGTKEGKRAKQLMQLTTHGTRSLLLARQASRDLTRPVLVRSVTTQVGAKESTEEGCGLFKWPPDQLQSFRDDQGLQGYQERLSKLLEENPSVRVINLSLGYKKPWISEDNPRCSKQQVNDEYDVLVQTWKNLLQKFPNHAFVVAAGNESEDFSDASLKENDLWANLSDQDNLFVVGSLDPQGEPMPFSNKGLDQMVWMRGADVPLPYPVPFAKEGYPSFAHGTSSSAALASGEILNLMNAGLSFSEIRNKLK